MRYGVLTAILTVAAATAVGCSHTSTTASTATSVTASSAASATSTSPATGPVLEVTIASGKATPANAAVPAHVGQPITVHVTSDAADELHVHSTPDHEFAIAAAPNQTFTFTVNEPGKVEVELHHLDQTVATIDVTP
jgi:hypothetical protein